MNSKQAKQIQIIDFLLKNGYEPINKKSNEYWYLSPFREEKQPSFKVDIIKNIWYDFGSCDGGSIIDLLTKLYNITISEALKQLSNISDIPKKANIFSFSTAKNIKVNKIDILNNNALIDYLKKRCINLDIARKYTKEVYYSINDKNYFGIGFKNDLDGYEIRNKYIKLNINGKSGTTINNNSSTLNIFEGFFDFLSYSTIMSDTFVDNAENNDFLILNSLALIKYYYKKFNTYDKINLYLDNDFAGQKEKNHIVANYKQSIDLSNIYAGFKDYNEYLINRY